MTYKEKFRQTKSWKRRAVIISLYFLTRKAKGHSVTVRTTAKYFQISIGAVSEAMLIANNYNDIKLLKSRAAALRFIKGL